MAANAEQFGKALTASAVMTADEVRALWSALAEHERPKDGDAFAKLLVERKKLTSFQAAEILAGRGARLSMGEYVLLAEIGAGGMGHVYKARHRRMKRFVALKVMSNAAMRDSAAVKRFQREVQAAARLEHPNIVTAYDSGESGEVKYLVMQFVDGGDLSDLVKKQGALPIDVAVDYILQAAQGLAYAHSEHVVHRDIKPANLLLDQQGVVKILDMGLARIEGGDDGLTATEQVMGTVDYMSPEQASDTKHADARADIYSLGCTLWYLLTARKLYEADSMIGRLMAHRDGPLPSLVKTRDDAPWPLEQVFHKMIAKRPQDRYQTMDEVIGALAPFAGNRGSTSGGSGLGSSSSVGTNSELASFMQAMGPGPANSGPAKTSPANTSAANTGAAGKTGGGSGAIAAKGSSGSKTSLAANLDATQHFDRSEADTDPNSAIALASGSSPTSLGAASAKANTRSKSAATGSTNNKKRLAGGVVGALLLVAAGIVVKLRGPEETSVATDSKGPNVASAAIVPTPAIKPTPAPVATRPPVPPIPPLPSKVEPSFAVDRKSAEGLNAKFRLVLALPDGTTRIIAPAAPLPNDDFRIVRIARESATEAVPPQERDETLLPLIEPLTQLDELADGANRLGLNSASLARLAQAPCARTLRSLVLGAPPGPQIVAAIGRFPKLDSVRLVATSITDPDAAALLQLHARIKRLALYDFNKSGHLTDIGLKTLAEIPVLDLVFENNDSAFDAKTFAALAANPKLRSITFRNSAPQFSFGDAELAELGKSKSLRLLDLYPPKKTPAITEAGIRALAALLPSCTFAWSGGTITARNADRFLKPKPGEVVDLLPHIDPDIHAHKGRWSKEDGALFTSPDPDPCSLELPVEPAAAYRIEATVERVAGAESFGIVLPVGTSEVRLVFDGYLSTGIRSGLDLLDGKKTSELADAFGQPLLILGEPAKIIIDVAPDRVSATCNGNKIVDFRGDSRRLSMQARSVFDYRFPPRTLSIFAYRPQHRVTKLTYTAK